MRGVANAPLTTPSAHLRAHVTKRNYVAWLKSLPPAKQVGTCKSCPVAYWLLHTLSIAQAQVDTSEIDVRWRGGHRWCHVPTPKWIESLIYEVDLGTGWRLPARKVLELVA